mgnify:CR=1 FL=1
MTGLLKPALALCAATVALTGMARAQIVDEFRVGIAMHDFEINPDDRRESGVDIQPQIVFGSPGFLRWAFEPQPYLMMSINSDQETNWAGGGILWKKPLFSEQWFWEIDGGVVYHDGRTDLPPPWMPVERQYVLDHEITFGDEWLFQFMAGAGRELNEDWDVQVYFEHLSTGQVFGDSSKNEGIETIGVKFGYKFD